MKNHFQKSLKDFEYVICFDLAKFETGISIINIKNLNELSVDYVCQLSIDKNDEEPFSSFFNQLNDFFIMLSRSYDINKILVVREKQPSGFNVTTTIATLQALAGIHAILDIVVNRFHVYEYENGIHASSVKAWAREVLQLDKPQKQDIHKFLINKYPELLAFNTQITFDISDSIALAECLIQRKWNADIKDIIKEKKKKAKELKLQFAKEKILLSIAEYNNKLI